MYIILVYYSAHISKCYFQNVDFTAKYSELRAPFLSAVGTTAGLTNKMRPPDRSRGLARRDRSLGALGAS